MALNTGGQGFLSQFAPLSPRANRIIVGLTWLAILVVAISEFIANNPTCYLPSPDPACNRIDAENTYDPGYLSRPENLWHWDWMLLSGLMVFALSIAFVDSIKPKLHRCIARLFDRGVLQPGAMSEDGFQASFAADAKRWALRGALLTAAAMALAWAFVLWTNRQPMQVPLALVQIILGFIAGGYIGEMACFGRLGRRIQTGDVALHLDPWHADGTAGLRPVGSFFFYQATFATIPAAFLAIWIWILPLWDNYAHWYLPYLALLIIAIIVQTLAVFLPLGSFHIEMMRQKREWRRKLDEEFRQNSAQRAAFLDSANIDKQNEIEAVLDLLTKRHQEVEAMPTWPIDRNLWRKFTFRNAFLLAPILVDFTLGATNWKSVLSAFMGLS
ncbi:hypothetical protein [Yoonia sp. R2-816]|uniref:hypothetical protein n=1 Tax=Yoonia sp. R2-816 TaxID=3342638 RepID=UPI0037283E26